MKIEGLKNRDGQRMMECNLSVNIRLRVYVSGVEKMDIKMEQRKSLQSSRRRV